MTDEHINMVQEMFSKAMTSKDVTIAEDEAWIIEVDGKRFVLGNGKSVWKKKQHASSALTNHMSHYEYFSRGIHYETRREMQSYLYNLYQLAKDQGRIVFKRIR